MLHRLPGRALLAPMAKEVERKFLVNGQEWRSLVEGRIRIRQFYLASNTGRSVRLRISDGEVATLTLKFGSRGRVRDEFEYQVPLAEAEEMMDFAIGRVIEKTRHHVSHRGRLYEIDVFGGELRGLIIAELETPEDVPASELPAWLGREVTGDPRYYNASLAHSDDVPEAVA
jgi:adenylate cyclase